MGINLQGLRAGLAIGEKIGQGANGIARGYIDNKIGAALKEEFPLIDDAQTAKAEFQANSTMRAPTEMPEAAAPVQDPNDFDSMTRLGVQAPQPTAELGQMSAAGLRTPQQPAPQGPKTSEEIAASVRTRKNPMQDYMRYQKAAEIAAEYGELDRVEAYRKMAQSAFKTGVGAYTLEALNKLQQGDASGVQSFMTNVMPDGYRYADFQYDPNTRTITGRQIGADGEVADDYTLNEDAVLGMARQLTTDENTVNKLYEARAAADAELLKYQRELAGKQFQSALDTNKDVTVEKYRQGGRMQLAQFNQGHQNARFGARLGLDWFKAGNDAAYKNGMLKLREREVDGKLQGNERANVKFWDSLGYNPEEINLAEQLVKAGNSVAQVNSAVGGGMDISRTQFTPGVGATVPVAGGGAVKVNIDGLLKMVDDPDQVEAVRSGYVSSATSAFDQGFAGWRDKWSTWTPKQRRDVLEAQGVGMDPDQFATYAGLTPKAPTKKPQPKVGGLRVDTGGGRVYDPAAVAQAAARDNASRASSEKARAQKVLAEENARRAKAGLPPLAP